MVKRRKLGIVLFVLVISVSLISGFALANGKTKPFKNIQVNEIDKIMAISYDLKTTKTMSSKEIDDIVRYLKNISIEEGTKIDVDVSNVNILGAIVVYFKDSSMKEIYLHEDMIAIDGNWYIGSVKGSTSFNELYDSLNGEVQPWLRNK